MGQHRIRLQVFKTANDDGSDAATVSQSRIASRVTRANEIYQSAGIEFLFQPSTNLVTLNSTLLNKDFTLFDDPAKYTSKDTKPPHDAKVHAQARTRLASLYPRRLVLFFTHRTKLKYDENAGYWVVARRGGSSSWASLYVHMPGNGGDSTLLAHEVGHYLQIRHTHRGGIRSVAEAASSIKKYVENSGHPKSEGLDVLDGDRVWVSDTPADAAGTIFVAEGLDQCGSVGQLTIPVQFTDGSSKSYVLAPDRSNIMSYFKGCPGPKTVSSQQGQRVRDGLEIGLRHRLVSLEANALTGTVHRRGSAGAGAISRLDLVQVRGGRVATAVRDSESKLRVIAWDLSPTGATVTRRGTGKAGAVGEVAICGLGLEMVATAVRDSRGNLKVILWRVTSAGAVQRLGSASAGKVSRIAACRLGIEHLATAVRDARGNLKVIVWHVTAAGTVKRVADASAGAASELAISSVGHNSVVTHLRDGRGNLRLITWQLEDNRRLVRRGTARAGGVSALAGACPDWYLPVSAMRDSGGNLKVIAWQVSDDDRDIARRADAKAGTISRVAACGMGIDLLATALKDSGNNLKVILWQVAGGGYHVKRLGDAGAGGISRVAVCPGGGNLLVTAVETREHTLKVIAWRIS